MNHARSVYAPFVRWAQRRRLIALSPMSDFELPTTIHVTREHQPPEVEQLCPFLEAATEVVPVAPLLLGAVTGTRRDERANPSAEASVEKERAFSELAHRLGPDVRAARNRRAPG